MTISRQELENQERVRKQEFVESLPLAFTEKQVREMNSINTKLREEKEDTGVIRAKHLEPFNLEEVKDKYQEKYESIVRQRDASASDRDVREKAESKTKTAMDLHKKLQELCGSLKGFKDIVNLNYTVQLIKSYSTKRHVALEKNDSKKLSTLKKKAPAIYERYLKLEHVEKMLKVRKNDYPDLYEFAQQDLQRAKSEWQHTEEMAARLVVEKPQGPVKQKKEKKIAPKIDKAKEKKQLQTYKSLHNRFVADTKNDDNDTVLDQDYKDELEENLKQKTMDWSILEDKEFNALKKKVSVYEPDPEDAMNYVLAFQMKKILADPANKGVTPQQVEKTVNEYLKRMIEKSAFQARIKMDYIIPVLNTRYFSNSGIGAYNKLMKKQYSENTSKTAHQCLSFGSLGADDAKGILVGAGGSDPVSMYGNITIRLNKEKMKGRVTFVCGNSKGEVNSTNAGLGGDVTLDFYDVKHGRAAYIDEKAGHAPDITACGMNLEKIYKRAKELEARNWEGLQDGGREAVTTITDKPQCSYFETHYHGNVGVAELDEVTFILNRGMPINLAKANEYTLEKNIEQDEDLRELYDYINIVNKNPKIYGREGMDDLKLTVWDTYGNTMSFEDIKKRMEKPRKK